MEDFMEIYGAFLIIAIIVLSVMCLCIGAMMLNTARDKGYNVEEKHFAAWMVLGFLFGFYILVVIYIAALPDLKTQKMLERLINENANNNNVQSINEELPEI